MQIYQKRVVESVIFEALLFPYARHFMKET